jgi:hypothetical protein
MSMSPQHKSSDDAVHHKFQWLRHYIGRLGYHIRTVKSLMACAPRLIHLLDAFEVHGIPTPSKASRLPSMDGKTRLDSIMVRMLPAGSPDLPSYQNALKQMDIDYQLTVRMQEKYGNPKHRPRVHSEIQVLEHFQEQNLHFEDNDKYIACSKPACYCCHLYFCHHPGGFEEPPSHGKLYISWRPPGFDLEPGSIKWKKYRKILNDMTDSIRKKVLHQISLQQAPRPWHPDSITGITESVQWAQKLLSSTEDVQTITRGLGEFFFMMQKLIRLTN